MTIRPHSQATPFTTRVIATTVALRAGSDARRSRDRRRGITLGSQERRRQRMAIAVTCIAAGFVWLVVFG